ncbi:MAG: ATP-binding protein [Sterolibacterium sp.]|jgi:two-component system osmolarity sensor histidine kinase EnvZ
MVRQNALLLGLVFFLFELISAAVISGFVVVPIASRSTNDLANLMIISAQTWNELPPTTRGDFELELAEKYQLALRGPTNDQVRADAESPHSLYLYFLEQALNDKTGTTTHLTRENVAGVAWYWRPIGSISVGLPERRIGAQPVVALLVLSAIGLVLALLVAYWLAHRLVVPFARLEAAANRVGRGEIPLPLPETGPQELAALTARFNSMASQVRQLVSARTTLLAGVSHDLRTPMARMRLALALLAETPSPRLIARLEADIDEMDQLIGKVLDLARGLEPEDSEIVDVVAMLESLVDGTTTGQIVIRADDPDATVTAPPLALKRAAGNLIDNALRYGEGKPVELAVKSAVGRLRIGVLDRGPGIPPEQIEAVFQPFHRVEVSRSPTTGGAGLGLAVVRQLADLYGWSIELTSRDGGGLEAWLGVPVE